MSETPMNKLRELVERWRSESGGDLPTSIREVVTELDPIVSDVERLETEVANLKAHREKFEKTNGELTDYAYLCKLEGQVERLVEAPSRILTVSLYRSLERLSIAIEGCGKIGFEESKPTTNEQHGQIWLELNDAQKDAKLKLKHYGLAPFDPPVAPKEIK